MVVVVVVGGVVVVVFYVVHIAVVETIARFYFLRPSFVRDNYINVAVFGFTKSKLILPSIRLIFHSFIHIFIHSFVHSFVRPSVLSFRRGRCTMPSEEAGARRPSTWTRSGGGPGTLPDRRRA